VGGITCALDMLRQVGREVLGSIPPQLSNGTCCEVVKIAYGVVGALSRELDFTSECKIAAIENPDSCDQSSRIGLSWVFRILTI
jgi:hypothetical protein